MELLYGFTFVIVNKPILVCCLIMKKVLGMFHPRQKRLTYISQIRFQRDFHFIKV